MLKKLMMIAPIAGLLCWSSLGRTQALPTATGTGTLQVGAGWTYANPDYGQKAIQGATAFADFNFFPRLGVEAEYHYISLITPTDLGENSFFGGPRYIFPHGKFNFYAKALIGIGDFVIQEAQDNPQGGAGTYFAYGAGAGVDYQIKKRIFVRGDFEYQRWSYLTGLTPSVFTVAFVYRFR